jgi:4-amino-4-deoxy-L-arabinose transferase-like glycosyltransferase
MLLLTWLNWVGAGEVMRGAVMAAGPREMDGQSRWLFWLAIVVALVLRGYGLGAHGLWLDEFFSLASARGFVPAMPLETGLLPFDPLQTRQASSLGQVLTASILTDGGNGVLFYLLLHGVTGLMGVADSVVRLPALLPSLAIVPLIYFLAKDTFGQRTANWAIWMAACHPLFIYYAREARGYSLATAMALLAIWALLRMGVLGAAHQQRSMAVLAGGAAGCAVLSHYLAVPVLVTALGLALCLPVYRRQWGHLLLAVALPVLMVGTWMMAGGLDGLAIIAQRSAYYQERLQRRLPDDNFALPATPANLAAGVVQTVNAMTGNTMQAGGLRLRQMLWWLFIPGLLLGSALGAAHWRGQAWSMLLLGVSCLGSSVFLALKSGHIIPLQPLYNLFSAPYIIVLMAAGCAVMSRRLVWVALPCLVIAVVTGRSLVLVYADAPKYRLPNRWAETAIAIAQQARAEDLVVFDSWVNARLCSLYLPETAHVRFQVQTADTGGVIRLVHEGQIRQLWRLPVP